MALSGCGCGYDIRALVDDPEIFLKVNRLGFNLHRPFAEKALVKLVPGTENSYDLKLSETESDNTTSAYVLGYKTNEVNDALFLDIPRTGVEEGTLFFTAELSGCSVVVTLLNDNVYRVFHDYRVNSAVLYDNVAMFVDWDNYKIPGVLSEYGQLDPSKGRAVGHALACMQFKDGKWKLFVQRQYQGPFKQSDGVNWEVEVHLDVQSEHVYTSLQTSFEERRRMMQQRIKALGKKLGIASAIINRAEDATYGGSREFDENDASIRGWQDLRNAIQEELKKIEKQDKTATWQKAMDAVCGKHRDMLDAAQKLDRIWLWLHIKKATGTSGNESEGDNGNESKRGEVQPNDTISERYAEMERDVMSGSVSARFKKGYENYGSINIPQFKPTMTSSEMKVLFVTTDKLSEEEQGALCRHISIAGNQEPWLELHKVIQSDFELQSKGFLESAPQDFFLSNVGDKYGGRCYPLVRAMAVALSTGEGVCKNFLDKLREFSGGELTDAQHRNAKCLRDALAGLHVNAEAHSASTALRDMFGIPDVLEKLRSSKQTEIYALNTEAHSMLVGVTVIDNHRKYYFYDPNFLIACFKFEANFQQAMECFFVERGFAKCYEAFGRAEEPKFKLVLIDYEKMGQARVEGGVTVRQISSGIDLGDIFDGRKRNRVVGAAESLLAGDRDLRAALTMAEAYDWTARWRDASIRLVREEGLMGNWTPLLDTLHESTDGFYTMQYMNASNTEETRWVSTRDKTFKEFTSYLDPKWKALRKDFTFENGKFKAHAAVESAPIDGLNAMFAVQMIMDWLNSGVSANESAPSESIDSNLLLAIKWHSYVNTIQIGHTTLLDIHNVAALVKTALQGEQLAGKVSLSTFGNVFKSMATEGFGVGLGFANVGLDAYQLWLARDDVEKATFGSQLAFDLASSVAGVAGIGAGIVGASGVAMALSGAGVILGGLGIGVGALAQNFGKIASDAQEVGKYFAAVDEAYSGRGYIYKTDEKALVPLLGAVVTRVQMVENQIEVGFDSQFIYRTHHGSTGSGRINYFFWVGDMPRMVKDCSQAINVREGIGYNNDRFRLKFAGEADILVLPATPKSFISYEYQLLPFATGRHDKGFDVIRRLEEDERFDYDFYIFPSEYIIRKIQSEYVETKIVVVLDKRSIRLQIYPELPEQVCECLTYEVEGTGGEYCIGLAKGPSQLSLKTSGLDAEKTTWIIDGSSLAEGSFKVGKDFVNVGGITIHLGLEQKFSRLLMISPVGEVSLVDLASQKALILSEDAGKWTGNNETLQQHLGKLAREHRLSEHFVVVNNYIAEEKGHKREVGRAYYDAFSDRMLYTDVEADIGCEFIDVLPDSDEPLRSELPNGRVYTAADAEKDANATRDAFLGAVVGNDAYFFNTQYKSLWRVNAETHQITAKYFTSTQFEDADIQMSAVSQHGDLLSMAIRPINQSGRGVEEIMHLIHKDSMVLSSVIGNSDMFRRIRVMERLSLSELVGARETPGTMITLEKLAGQALVLPSIAELVTVLCKDENGDQFCCWLRTSDDTIIRANVQPLINDLILTTSSHKEHGREVFYFYSIKEEAVYCQQGPGHVNDSQAKQIKIPGLAKLFSVLGEVFAATKDGCILRLLVDGSLYLEAVNEHWLAQHPKWWLELPTLDGKMATSIAVMGVQDSKNRVVPIWYQDGKVVIASSKLHGKQLQFMGLNGDGQAAWLFDRENGLLYRQPLSTSGVMGAMVNSEGKLINEGDHEIPEAEAMLGGERLKDPATVDGSLRVTTESGVVLVVGGHSGMASLVAVDSAWQSSHEKEDLNNLANNWPPYCDVVVLQGDSDESVPGWYFFPSRETVTAQGLKWSDHPAWIGKSIDGLTSYIYAQAHCSLYGVDRASGVTSEKGKFTAAKVHGNSLVLQSTNPNAEINIPTVVGLDFAVVSATNAKVVIDEENWKRYKVIQINNKMEGNGDPMVEIKYSDEHFLIHKVGNDMVLVDGHRGSVLILANVLAEEAEQGGYKVKVGLGIDGKEFMISGFRKRLEKAHPLLEDGIFSVTEIIDLLKFKENSVE